MKVIYIIWQQFHDGDIMAPSYNGHVYTEVQIFNNYYEIYKNIPVNCNYMIIDGKHITVGGKNDWLPYEVAEKLKKEKEKKEKEKRKNYNNFYKHYYNDIFKFNNILFKKIYTIDLKVGDEFYAEDKEEEFHGVWFNRPVYMGKITKIIYSKTKKTVQKIITNTKQINLRFNSVDIFLIINK